MSAETVAGGRYRVERLLGRGGMAAVYLARDEQLARPVAIKLLDANLGGDEPFRERFVREARVAAGLQHPNIVTIYDTGEDAGRLFIVMEYVEGRTLAQRLRHDGRLKPEAAVDLILQACGGLEHAHAAGLVHRDVKPQNLLERRDGVLKIADFGIARAAEMTDLTQAGTILGTAAYLAPEQAAGTEVTAAADIYSLAAVLYELLTGRTPHEFETLTELVGKHVAGVITPVRTLAPEVPLELEDAVMRALAREPQYRPASAAEFAAQLAVASPEPPTEPIPVSQGVRATAVTEPLPRTVGPMRHLLDRTSSRFWIVVVSAAAVVAIVVALAVTTGGDDVDGREPVAVEPVPQGESPAEQARNLSAWLRDHAEPAQR